MPSTRIINTAIQKAKESQLEFRVGAVLYKGSSILRASENTIKYIGYRKKYFPFTPTRHAEVAVMHQVPRDILRGCSILVIRLDRDDRLTCSKPCLACFLSMKEAGISKAYYTDYNGVMQKLDFSIKVPDYRKDRPPITYDY